MPSLWLTVTACLMRRITNSYLTDRNIKSEWVLELVCVCGSVCVFLSLPLCVCWLRHFLMANCVRYVLQLTQYVNLSLFGDKIVAICSRRCCCCCILFSVYISPLPLSPPIPPSSDSTFLDLPHSDCAPLFCSISHQLVPLSALQFDAWFVWKQRNATQRDALQVVTRNLLIARELISIVIRYECRV